MSLYALFLTLIKYFFCGNEYLAAKSYLYVMLFIIAISFILMTIYNIKMWMI